MQKSTVVHAIREALQRQFEAFQERSRETRAAGADPENRAESKYDTRATEASYLADGQARQAQQAGEARSAVESLGIRPFGPGATIDLGALVRLEFRGGREAEGAWFFLSPAAGGLEVVVDGETVTVLNAGSPLGRQLLGRSVGATVTAPAAVVREVG